MTRQVLFRELSVGPMDNNVYALADPESNEGILIDPANEAELILQAVEDLSIQLILLTHGHADHIQALEEVRSATGAPFGIHGADAGMIPTTPDFELVDNSDITVGAISLRVIHTPGHTPGSVCFYSGSRLFSGDTLFPGGPGNTRGDRTAFDQIIASIRDKLFVLPAHTQVLPGHGNATTIGTERPELQDWIVRGW